MYYKIDIQLNIYTTTSQGTEQKGDLIDVKTQQEIGRGPTIIGD